MAQAVDAFDQGVTEYQDWAETPWGRLRTEMIWRQLQPHLPKPGGRILDAGCGLGQLAIRLALAGHEVTASDFAAEMIAAANKLHLIQRLGSLTYDIDLQAAQAAGVPVSAWPVHGCIRVAEHMLMQMLVLSKRLPEVAAVANAAGDWSQPSRRTDEDTFAYNWSERENIGGIYGATVGILGFGEVGAELTRRLRGLCPEKTLYHKRWRLPLAAEVELALTYAARDHLLAESDFVCNLLPYYPETDKLIGSYLLTRNAPGLT